MPNEAAVQFMEQVQLAYLRQHGRRVPGTTSMDQNANELRHFLQQLYYKEKVSAEEAEYHRRYADAYTLIKTQYQEPLVYSLIQDAINDLFQHKDTLPAVRALPVRGMPLFGSVMSNQFAAEACSPDGQSSIILISDGLISILNKMADLLALAFPFNHQMLYSPIAEQDARQVLNSICITPQIRLRYFDMALAGVLTGEPTRAKPPRDDAPLSTPLKELALRFVVCHEYAHFALGHLQSGSRQNVELGGQNVQHLFHRAAQEEEADELGCALTLLIGAGTGMDWYAAIFGILTCFSAIELVENVNQMRLEKQGIRSYEASAHAPAEARRKNLYKGFFSDGLPVLYKAFADLSGHLWNEFMMFYTLLEKMLAADGTDINETHYAYAQMLLYKMLSD